MTAPLLIHLEADPFLNRAKVKVARYKGATPLLLRSLQSALDVALHLYVLKERIEKGYRLADCLHPKARLRRTKHGTICTKCGARMNKRQIRQRAEPLREIRKALAQAPIRRQALG